MPEKILYERCEKWEECHKAGGYLDRRCPADLFGKSCYRPVPPQPAPYSPKPYPCLADPKSISIQDLRERVDALEKHSPEWCKVQYLSDLTNGMNGMVDALSEKVKGLEDCHLQATMTAMFQGCARKLEQNDKRLSKLEAKRRKGKK